MKPSKLFRAIRQSLRDRRVYELQLRPRLLMPVPFFIDTNLPHTLKLVNCQWYHGIQNLVVPKDYPAFAATRNIIRIDVGDPNSPASLLLEGMTSDLTKSLGYRASWDGKRWTSAEQLICHRAPQPTSCRKIPWIDFDWIRT